MQASRAQSPADAPVAAPVTIEALRALVAPDMDAVDELIRRRLSSKVALVNQLGHYIVALGGKRLRPMLSVLTARALGYTGTEHVAIAAIIELIHTATLLHDDVVDESDVRRGQATANDVWGNPASILVGDFLYSRSFEMMVELNRMPVMEILARTTNTIAEGEVLQLMHCRAPDASEQIYLEIVRCKTARLFEAATELAAVVADQPAEIRAAARDYGLNLGMAFQLVDDALDYGTDSARLGKNVGDDLAEGKPTLPLIHAYQNGTPDQQALLRQAVESGDRAALPQVLAAIESTGSLAYTSRRAREYAERARQAARALPPSAYTRALGDLADFTIARSS